MRRAPAALLTAVALLATAAGCTCHCDRPLDTTAERPGDTVRALRDAILEERDADARACFAEGVRAKVGDEFRRPPWFAKGDEVRRATVDGNVALVEVEHSQHREKTPLPTVFELQRDPEGRWKITAWRS